MGIVVPGMAQGGLKIAGVYRLRSRVQVDVYSAASRR